jgi:TolB-like protein
MVKKISYAVILALLPFFLLSGCETTSPKGMHVHPKVGLNFLSKLIERKILDDNLVEVSHQVADSLIEKARATLSTERALVAASFVDIDDLERSSSFGRIISQQIASRFAASRFHIVELLLRKNIYIKQKAGEFLLSRELRNIGVEHNVQAAIVGTYAVGKEEVYVTAKVVRSEDSIVIASHDYTLALGPNTRFLLGSD